MIAFSCIKNGKLAGHSFLIVDEKEIYLDVGIFNHPDVEGYGFIEDARNVYCVNWTDEVYCAVNTVKLPIIYFYESYEFSMAISSARRIEYTSAMLVRFMCSFKHENKDFESYIDDEFAVAGMKITFEGHRLYKIKQNNNEQEFDPVIVIEYYNEKDANEVLNLVRSIDDFFRLITFSKSVERPQVKLINNSGQYLFFNIVENSDYEHYSSFILDDQYEVIKKYIPTIFEYILKNNIDSAFFEKCHKDENAQRIFMDVCGAFDKLSSQHYAKVENENLDLENFKIKIWNKIENDEDYDKMKDQIRGLRNRILSYGTENGLKKRLEIAFDDILRFIPRRAKFYEMNNKNIVKRIFELRTDIVHKGEIVNFTQNDISCIEKFQWITYIILLRTIGIDDNALEDWMDRVAGVG